MTHLGDKVNLDELESGFSSQLDLTSFYHSDEDSLDANEQLATTPILHSLRENDEWRYTESIACDQGGEKCIAKVFDRSADRYVALALPRCGEHIFDKESFLREGRVTAKLQHPNIVSVYDMGIQPDGTPFFTMEFINGESLRSILRNIKRKEPGYINKYSREDLLNIFVKICDAISYAHARNVLHLDLKPGNIKVGHYGEVIVYDWGLSKVKPASEDDDAREPAIDDDELDADMLNDVTLSGTVKGTPGYMAPEQVESDGNKDRYTDIYALGAILYSILCECQPVETKDIHSALEQTRNGDIKHPDKRCPDRRIPPGLSAVAMKALETDPAKRYRSVKALQQEILKYLSGFATEAEQATFAKQLVLLFGRHRLAASLLLIFIICLSLVVSVSLHSIRMERNEAVKSQELAERNLALFKKEFEKREEIHSQLTTVSKTAPLTPDPQSSEIIISSLNHALSSSTDQAERQQLWRKKGNTHFTMQQFKLALASYRQCNDELIPMELAELAVELKKNDEQYLTWPQLGQLLSSFKTRENKELAYGLFTHQKQNVSVSKISEAIDAVKNILDLLNNCGHDEYLVKGFDDASRHLDLSGNRYQIFTLPSATPGEPPLNVLSILNLDSLDICNSKLLDLERIDGITLKKLFITGTDIISLRLDRTVLRLGNPDLYLNTKAVDPRRLKAMKKAYKIHHHEHAP